MTDKHPVLQEIESRLAARLNDVKRDFSAPLVVGAGDDLSAYAAGEYDAVLSHFGAVGVENPPEYILTLGRLLRPDGLFLASMLGAESFQELRGLKGAPEFALLPDVRDVGAVLTQYKFALPVVDRDVMTLTFDTAHKVVETVLACGFSDLVGGAEWLADADFPRRADGKIALTVEVIYAHGWFPAAGQPVALAPGSGVVDLKDVLG